MHSHANINTSLKSTRKIHLPPYFHWNQGLPSYTHTKSFTLILSLSLSLSLSLFLLWRTRIDTQYSTHKHSTHEQAQAHMHAWRPSFLRQGGSALRLWSLAFGCLHAHIIAVVAVECWGVIVCLPICRMRVYECLHVWVLFPSWLLCVKAWYCACLFVRMHAYECLHVRVWLWLWLLCVEAGQCTCPLLNACVWMPTWMPTCASVNAIVAVVCLSPESVPAHHFKCVRFDACMCMSVGAAILV